MPDRPWFKARRYGWGWTPVSVEGWLVVWAFLVLTLASIAAFVWVLSADLMMRRPAAAALAILVFLLWMGLLVGAQAWIARRTGERPRWRWGD